MTIRTFMATLAVVLVTAGAVSAEVSDFENLTISEGTYWNGSDGSGEFASGGAAFFNNYNPEYGSWDGFAYSTGTDTTEYEWAEGQYISSAGRGYKSRTYGVGYCSAWSDPPTIEFGDSWSLTGVHVTTTTYSHHSMREGDDFAKKFEASDWCTLTVTGKDASGGETGAVDFFLGNGTDILDGWAWLDLSGLGEVESLEFTMSSSDTGDYGMNTPSYFCLDDLNGAPPSVGEVGFEDVMLGNESIWNGENGAGRFVSGNAVFSNNYDAAYGSWDGFACSNITAGEEEGFQAQYNSAAGCGAVSSTYGVGYCSAWAAGPPTVTFPKEQEVTGAYFTNNSYAYFSMLNGDEYCKKFEEGDWFTLTITGKDSLGEETGTVEFKLADGTDIVRSWAWVDMSGLGSVKSLEFTLDSSDTGDWGMNTPAYFCMDNLNGSADDADVDMDGVPDSQEVGGGVDLDGDGTADADQGTLKAVNTVVGSAQVGVSRAGDSGITEVVSVRSVDPSTVSDDDGKPASMPFGLIDFTLKVAVPGDTVKVTVYFSEAAPGAMGWYKYDAVHGWTDFSDHAEFSADRTSVVLELEDGGPGDADGIANGIIVDPSGAGGVPVTGGDGGGCFIGSTRTGSSLFMALVGSARAAWSRVTGLCGR